MLVVAGAAFWAGQIAPSGTLPELLQPSQAPAEPQLPGGPHKHCFRCTTDNLDTQCKESPTCCQGAKSAVEMGVLHQPGAGQGVPQQVNAKKTAVLKLPHGSAIITCSASERSVYMFVQPRGTASFCCS